MTDEIIEKIKYDLETAAYIDRLLPAVRAPKYRCCMPDIIYTEQEKIFMDKKPLKIRPNQEQISLWERVIFEWLLNMNIGNHCAHKTGFTNTCCNCKANTREYTLKIFN